MKSILFLEGPIQTGKSTLIREALGTDIHKCGGYASQRLLDASGRTRGFRIGPAASTALTAPLKTMILRSGMSDGNPGSMSNDAATSGQKLPHILLAPDGSCYDHVFKYTADDGKVYKDQSVFAHYGAGLLSSAKGSSLVLLDELGGAELLCDPFMAALEDLLAGGTPCLGVLKLAEGARHMQRAYGGRGIAERNLQLRQRILEEYQGTILYFDRTVTGCADRIRRELELFLSREKQLWQSENNM